MSLLQRLGDAFIEASEKVELRRLIHKFLCVAGLTGPEFKRFRELHLRYPDITTCSCGKQDLEKDA